MRWHGRGLPLGGAPNRRQRLLSAGSLCGSILAVLSAAAWGAPGSTTLNFLKIGLAPRPVSLGEAYVGLADDVNAISYNPAGLALLRRQEAAFTHNEFVSGLQQDYLAYAYPTSRWGTLGFAANLLRVAPFDSYDENDQPIGTVSSQDMALTGAYAYRLDPFAFGFSGKFLRSRLAEVRAESTALDIGGLLRVTQRLRLGFAVQNLGPDVRYENERFPLPLTTKLGASFSPAVPLKGSRLTLTVEGSFPRDRSPYPSAGLEFFPMNMAVLRVGYQGSQDSGLGLTLGAGLRLSSGGLGSRSGESFFQDLEVDYAYVGFGNLGNAHRIGLLMRFGRESKPAESPRAAVEEPPAALTPEDHFERADKLLSEKSFDQARTQLTAVSAMLSAKDPLWVRYYERHGAIALAQKKYGQAKSHYLEGLRRAGQFGISSQHVADMHLGLGKCLLVEGNPGYALMFFKKSMELRPSVETLVQIEYAEKALKANKAEENPR